MASPWRQRLLGALAIAALLLFNFPLMLDETSQVIEYSERPEQKSRAIEHDLPAAAPLRCDRLVQVLVKLFANASKVVAANQAE